MMNKQIFSTLCVVAGLALLPGCGKTTREQKVEDCKDDLKRCADTVKSAGKDVKQSAQKAGKQLKCQGKELGKNAAKVCKHTEWCGCEK